jgi:hypothetical protein
MSTLYTLLFNYTFAVAAVDLTTIKGSSKGHCDQSYSRSNQSFPNPRFIIGWTWSWRLRWTIAATNVGVAVFSGWAIGVRTAGTSRLTMASSVTPRRFHKNSRSWRKCNR